MFEVVATLPGTQARAGLLHTPHGTIPTPAYLPVGTLASVKALTPDDLQEMATPGIFANTYHLFLRPGEDLVAQFGGVHGFMKWDGPLMTDSGGFQAFSLGYGIEHQVGKIGGVFPGEATGSHRSGRPAAVRHREACHHRRGRSHLPLAR